jgi:hypothetical protein
MFMPILNPKEFEIGEQMDAKQNRRNMRMAVVESMDNDSVLA